MSVLCIILFLAVSSLWFFANEYPALFGIYVPTCVLKRSVFKFLVAAVLIVSVFLSQSIGIGENMIRVLSPDFGIDCQSLMTVLLSAMIILLILKQFSVRGSAVYAILGAFLAYMTGSGYEKNHYVLLSFVAAPAFSFALSACLKFLADRLLEKSHVHLITLSHYIRIAVISSILLTAFALGLNWGGFLSGGSLYLASGSSSTRWLVTAVLFVAIVVLSPSMRKLSDDVSARYEDFSAYTILSVGVSVALVLILFSFGIFGLYPVPLAPGSLIIAAIAGAGTVSRSPLVENEEYVKEIMAFLVAPLGALVIAYLIFYLSGNNDEQLIDFTVMSAAVLVLVALTFAGYVRRQRIVREATERLVYSQQQQIYENSRALNDMELKVVISENQALHNSIEMKRQEVMNVALSMVEQKEYLESLSTIVSQLSKTKDEKERDGLISELSKSLKQRLSYDRDVDSQYFYAQAESLHEDFNAKLSENFPDLTQQERRLATLLRLGFSSKYIATLMNITPKSVEISRYRLRQKLGLSKGDNLVNFIKSI